eukprot:1185957-Prorocentrum_minimum.AAC.2
MAWATVIRATTARHYVVKIPTTNRMQDFERARQLPICENHEVPFGGRELRLRNRLVEVVPGGQRDGVVRHERNYGHFGFRPVGAQQVLRGPQAPVHVELAAHMHHQRLRGAPPPPRPPESQHRSSHHSQLNLTCFAPPGCFVIAAGRTSERSVISQPTRVNPPLPVVNPPQHA